MCIQQKNSIRPLVLLAFIFSLGGCASYAKIENAAGIPQNSDTTYSIHEFHSKWQDSEDALILTFSGGGTRAAALAYGVLEELRDTKLPGRSENQRLLDKVHTISSVSGGSFTAAYYGLYGERIFRDFQNDFLRKDIQSQLIHGVMNPLGWFSRTGRTDMAVKYYEKTVFKNATFADMLKPGRPLILINASDFAEGVRFSFIQGYFNLLCSDLSSFPVARAVAASSAVPVLFNPVVLENYPECSGKDGSWLDEIKEMAKGNPELMMTVKGLETYYDTEKRKYIHMVDGGITDNLGLRAIYDIIELNGGVKKYISKYDHKPPRRIIVISVNAATDPESAMDQTNMQPSIAQSINAMSDVQMRRYSADTIELMEKSLKRWSEELSTENNTVQSYFIRLDFTGIQQTHQRFLLNQIPTSFYLSDEQVDQLIEVGGELLRTNSEFNRLMTDMKAENVSGF